MTLTDFLLARIAEDEAAAKAAAEPSGPDWFVVPTDYEVASHPRSDVEARPTARWPHGSTVVYDEGHPHIDESLHIARWDPARVLADCEAKRRIVEDLSDSLDEMGGWGSLCERQLAHLATVYADHPDYQAEWAEWSAELTTA